jgi:multiple sugar transport system substrate-binding protein
MASPSTTALTRLLPYLEKTTGIHLELTVLPSLRDVYQLLQTTKRSRFDLIRMDVAWMDELAAKLFKPLNQIEGNWNHLLSQTIPELGQHYTSSDNTLYCLPYDPSTQLLFYRQDLFTDPTIKRQYFEYCRQELTVPKTFDEYNHIAGFFTRQNNPTSPTPYGSTIAIGNVVVSPSEFLVRLFACGGKLLDEQGYITVDTPQALAALQNYQQTYQYSDRFVYDIWKNALAGFADGSAAMTVVFINYASEILNSKLSSIAGKVGYAPVPGGLPLLGGGVIGITNDCADCQAASVFLQWLYSDLVAPVFTTLGGLSPCQSAYSNRDINERYPWLSATRHSFGIAQRRGSSNRYRNFSELKLETIIADNVQLAVLGTISAKQALHQAQSECDQYFIKA